MKKVNEDKYNNLMYRLIIISFLVMIFIKSIFINIDSYLKINKSNIFMLNLNIVFSSIQIISLVCLTIKFRKRGFNSSIALNVFQLIFILLINKREFLIADLVVLIGNCMVLSIINYYVNKSKKREAELFSLAYTDPLTNVFNRRGLNVCLNRVIKKNKIIQKEDIAVVFIDLDNFKIVNDTKGHEYGDYILSEVAKRWKNTLRNGDYIARYGGDEFVLILNNYDSQPELNDYINEFFQDINREFIFNNEAMKISASFGVALYSYDKGDVEELLRYADIAMNNAKRNGKRGIDIFDSELEEVRVI